MTILEQWWESPGLKWYGALRTPQPASTTLPLRCDCNFSMQREWPLRQKDLVNLIEQSLRHQKNNRLSDTPQASRFSASSHLLFAVHKRELESPRRCWHTLLMANTKRFGEGCYKFCNKTTRPLIKCLPNLCGVEIVLHAQLQMHRSFRT